MGSTSLRSATSRSSFLLTRRRPQPKQPQHMFGWLSKKPLGCDPMVSASLAARTIALEMERDVGGMGQLEQDDSPLVTLKTGVDPLGWTGGEGENRLTEHPLLVSS